MFSQDSTWMGMCMAPIMWDSEGGDPDQSGSVGNGRRLWLCKTFARWCHFAVSLQWNGVSCGSKQNASCANSSVHKKRKPKHFLLSLMAEIQCVKKTALGMCCTQSHRVSACSISSGGACQGQDVRWSQDGENRRFLWWGDSVWLVIRHQCLLQPDWAKLRVGNGL